MDENGARTVIANSHTFEEMEDAIRIERIMSLPAEERDALFAHLLFELRSDVHAMRERRNLVTAGAHVATMALAAVIGLFGQPYVPK